MNSVMDAMAVRKKMGRKNEIITVILKVGKDITEKYMIRALFCVVQKYRISDTENSMMVGVEGGKAEWSHT